MLRTILLAVGAQDADHTAVDLGVRWARQTNSLLVGLGIIDEDAVHPLEAAPLGAGPLKAEMDAKRLAAEQQRIESCLSALALRSAREQVPFKPLECIGQPAEEISLESQRFDLIMMPRHAHYFHGPTESGLGKAMWSILRAAPRPVVAVPEQASGGAAIVIAYDGSLQAARAVQALEATGLAGDRPVFVVALDRDHVVAARRGDRAVQYLDHHGIHAKLHAEAVASQMGERIMELARELDAGLLVMGACGQPRAIEFFLGSVTRTVLSNCTIPLFLCH